MIDLSSKRDALIRRVVFFAILLWIAPVLSQAYKRETSFPLRLRGGELNISIRNETENQNWNQYAFEKVKGLLDAYESYLGINFHQATFSIYRSLPEAERNRVRLVLKDSVFLNGTRIGGYNNASGELGKEVGIFMEADLIPQGYPALLLHELGHYYFTEPSWLSEGVVLFLPYLLAKKGYLRLGSEELLSVREEWSLEEKSPKKDFPIQQDFHRMDASLGPWYYSKAVRTQFILYKELGPEGYKTFLKRVASAETLSTPGVLEILDAVQKKEWNKILQGWVLPGAYTKYPIHSFLKPQEIEKL